LERAARNLHAYRYVVDADMRRCAGHE